MYAQLCSSTNEIFTSVVVYSRTKKTKKAKLNHKGVQKLLMRGLILKTIKVEDY